MRSSFLSHFTISHFVFSRLNEAIKLSDSLYGGRKGCGVDHMLIDMWETILSDLDRGTAASNLISLDFEMVFNCLDHDACILELERHGATR